MRRIQCSRARRPRRRLLTTTANHPTAPGHRSARGGGGHYGGHGLDGRAALRGLALVYVRVPRELVRARERLVAPRLGARVRACAGVGAELEAQRQCPALQFRGPKAGERGKERGRGMLTCFERFDDSEKARSQYEHLNGLLPLCVRLWIVSAPAIANALPHPGKSHAYGSG